MPLYFAEEEFPLFSAFLEKDVFVKHYAVVFKGNVLVGCGGIALNEPGKFTKEPHVVMTWGMIHRDYHKQNLGKALLEFRIKEAEKYYPQIKIALGTTQYTYKFFEKYGFKVVCFEKDHWAKGLDLYQMELSSLH